MGTPHKHAEIIKAWADGAIVQYSGIAGQWITLNDPYFSAEGAYRIKPEPKPDVSFYARLELDNLPKRVKVMMPDPSLHNVKLTFDGETGALKAAEVLK